MGALAGKLRKQEMKGKIEEYLHIGYAKWDKLIDGVAEAEKLESRRCDDEQVWTFLAACGYAIAGKDGAAKLTEILTGSSQSVPPNPKIWFEVLPLPPREKEGNTHIDLAVGMIRDRDKTGSGIELDAVPKSWICFCEMKWYSDISKDVSYDIHRNQLARVIENALCFQSGAKYADKVYVTLVTPAAFKDAKTKSRLYQYKFDEYKENPGRLVADLDKCCLPRSDYYDKPDRGELNEWIERLSLNWATYDELFDVLPASQIWDGLTDFWMQHGNYQGRVSLSGMKSQTLKARP